MLPTQTHKMYLIPKHLKPTEMQNEPEMANNANNQDPTPLQPPEQLPPHPLYPMELT